MTLLTAGNAAANHVAASGDATAPTQRGTATTENYWGSNTYVAAPTGLATGDVVYIWVYSEDSSYTDPEYTLTGFTKIIDARLASTVIHHTLLRGTIGATPPTSFTPSPANTPTYWEYTCLAFSGVGNLTGEVVGTPNDTYVGSAPANYTATAITVDVTSSLVLVIAAQQYGAAGSITDWTNISSSPLVLTTEHDAGTTGTVTITGGNEWRESTATLVAIPGN